MEPDPTEITAILRAHAAGDTAAIDRLLPRVYEELRRIARARLRRERTDHTYTPTDLVHEAFLKLVPLERVNWQDRAHFFAIASRAMRNVLVDHAMRRATAKRGGGQEALTLDDDATSEKSLADLIALSDALRELPPDQRTIVHLRLWENLKFEEIADMLGLSLNTAASRYRYGIDKLRQRLRPLYDEIK